MVRQRPAWGHIVSESQKIFVSLTLDRYFVHRPMFRRPMFPYRRSTFTVVTELSIVIHESPAFTGPLLQDSDNTHDYTYSVALCINGMPHDDSSGQLRQLSGPTSFQT